MKYQSFFPFEDIIFTKACEIYHTNFFEPVFNYSWQFKFLPTQLFTKQNVRK